MREDRRGPAAETPGIAGTATPPVAGPASARCRIFSALVASLDANVDSSTANTPGLARSLSGAPRFFRGGAAYVRHSSAGQRAIYQFGSLVAH